MLKFNSKDVIREIEESSTIKLSDEQLAILNHGGGMCILACAGSGKTTTTTKLVAKRIKTGEIANPSRLLLTTYSKAGSASMSEKLNEQLDALGLDCKVPVKTLHAFYLACLKKFGMTEKVCTEGQRMRYIRQAVKSRCKMKLVEEDIKNINNILSFQLNTMMTDKAVYHSYAFNVEISLEDYQAIRCEFTTLKNKDKMIDFDDMQFIMYCKLTQDHYFLEYCKSLYDYYYIDEFQDTNKLQFEIIKLLLKDERNLVVIGDDDQCIYGWRGADPSLIINICAYFDIQKFHLSTNYRCKSNILNFAKTGIEHMNVRESKDMKSFKAGGEVEFINANCKNLYGMELSAFNYIKEMVNDGVEPKNICVLVRNNAHAAVLSNMLMLNGIFPDVTNEIKLSGTPEFRDLQNLIEMAGDDTTPFCYNREVVSLLLWKMVPYLGTQGGNVISEIMDNTGFHLAQAIAYLILNHTYISNLDIVSEAINLNKIQSVQLPGKVKMHIEVVAGRFRSETIAGLMSLCKTLVDETVVEKRLAELIKLYKIGMEFTLGDINTRRVFDAFFKHFTNILNTEGLGELINILNSTKQYEESDYKLDWVTSGHVEKISNNRLRVSIGTGANLDPSLAKMSTAHSSKGLEWDTVIILGSDNVSFPSFRYIKDSVNNGVKIDEIGNYIDGERRLYYVASTRAKNKLVIIGDYNYMSLFALESLNKVQPYSYEDVVSLAFNYADRGKFDSSKEELMVYKDTDLNNSELGIYHKVY